MTSSKSSMGGRSSGGGDRGSECVKCGTSRRSGANPVIAGREPASDGAAGGNGVAGGGGGTDDATGSNSDDNRGGDGRERGDCESGRGSERPTGSSRATPAEAGDKAASSEAGDGAGVPDGANGADDVNSGGGDSGRVSDDGSDGRGCGGKEAAKCAFWAFGLSGAGTPAVSSGVTRRGPAGCGGAAGVGDIVPEET